MPETKGTTKGTTRRAMLLAGPQRAGGRRGRGDRRRAGRGSRDRTTRADPLMRETEHTRAYFESTRF